MPPLPHSKKMSRTLGRSTSSPQCITAGGTTRAPHSVQSLVCCVVTRSCQPTTLDMEHAVPERAGDVLMSDISTNAMVMCMECVCVAVPGMTCHDGCIVRLSLRIVAGKQCILQSVPKK